MRGRLITAVLVLALAAGCAGKTDVTGPVGELTAGEVRGGAPPPQTARPDGEITIEDIQWVIDAIDRARGEMMRVLLAAGHPTTESQAYLEAFFDGTAATELESVIGRAAARGFTGDTAALVEPDTTVRRVLAAGECVRALVERDGSSMTITLRPTRSARDPRGLNRTGWSIVEERGREDPCDASAA